MDIVGLWGKEYEFLVKIYIYLKKVREGKNILNFEVLRELLKIEKINDEKSIEYDEKYIFIKKVKAEIEGSILDNEQNNEQNDNNMLDLFNPYPINYKQLRDSLL